MGCKKVSSLPLWVDRVPPVAMGEPHAFLLMGLGFPSKRQSQSSRTSPPIPTDVFKSSVGSSETSQDTSMYRVAFRESPKS